MWTAREWKATTRTTKETRHELLASLSELSRIRPEWRLGQTMANLAMTAGRLDAGGVWELEDDEALAAARTLIGQYAEIDAPAEIAGSEFPAERVNRR